MSDKVTDVALSRAEMEIVRAIAKRDGVTEDEAASQLLSEGLARRVKKRTGKNPAKVYTLRKK